MSHSSRARPPAARAVPARRRVGGALLVIALLGAVPGLMLLPNEVAALRLAGLSLLWWYAGLVAPVLAVTGIVLLHACGADEGAGGAAGASDDTGPAPPSVAGSP